MQAEHVVGGGIVCSFLSLRDLFMLYCILKPNILWSPAVLIILLLDYFSGICSPGKEEGEKFT